MHFIELVLMSDELVLVSGELVLVSSEIMHYIELVLMSGELVLMSGALVLPVGSTVVSSTGWFYCRPLLVLLSIGSNVSNPSIAQSKASLGG